jgi:DNA-binding response OmpR family regulator
METLDSPAVLVVEDDPSIRGLIAEALQDDGYRVLEARNGREAIRAVNEQPASAEPPCLVLLDLMLPGIDGVRVLEQLAAPRGRVPVVAMSASRSHLAAAQAAGADMALPKPFDLDQLVNVVDAYCLNTPHQTPRLGA